MFQMTTGTFSLYDLLFYFFIYSIMGWIMETVLCSHREKNFVNRGYLSGPYCPIYGVGMCLIILFLTPYQDDLSDLLIGSMLLSTVLEYFTSWIMERLFHTKWWDYSDKKFNLHGRICLQILIAWGILTLVIMKFVHPIIQTGVEKIPQSVGNVILICLLVILLIDTIHATVVAAQLSRYIHQLEDIRSDLKRLTENSLNQEWLKKLDNQSLKEVLSQLKTNSKQLKLHTQNQLSQLHQNAAGLFQKHRKRIFEHPLLNAFPTMRSTRFKQTLKDIRENRREGKKKK